MHLTIAIENTAISRNTGCEDGWVDKCLLLKCQDLSEKLSTCIKSWIW